MPWTMEVKKLCQQGRLEESLKILDVMTQQGMQVPIATYTCVLKECARIKALEHGKHVHAHIHTCGVVPNIMLENTLVDMYGKCGSIYDAHRTFDHMSKHNVFSWTAIITAYVKEGKNHEAVELFQKMQNEGVIPDKFVVVIVLKACGTMEALKQGRQVHTDIIRCSIVLDLFLCSTLVDMYAKCKCIPDARQVFDNMTERDVVSWNAMISGYAQQGPHKEAIVLFEAMQRGGVKPSEFTFAFVIKACAVLADVERGKRFHKNIIRCGLSCNVFVANSLLDMYTKCGCLENAQQVFDDMHDRDVVSWTIIMACHVQQGLGRRALTLYKEMQQYNVLPNADTFVSALNACAREESFKEGRQLHAQIIETGLVLDTFIGSSLVDMYAKCGSIDDASHVFTMIPNQDVVSWNAIIVGCTQQGLYVKALSLFVTMHQAGIEPGGITFASIIKASASSVAPEQGKRLHAYVVEKALEYDVFVGSTLVDMYAKYGSIKDAFQVFSKLQKHDIVVWNTMMTGYVQQGLEEESVMLFESLTCEGAKPNETTFTIILKACASLTVLEWGKVLHCQVFEKGYESYLVKSALLDMYAKCGSIEDARSLFNKMHTRDVVAWTAMITGYTLQGCGKEAVALFEEMHREGVKPNEVTFIGILCGCSHTGLMDEGHWLFAFMIRDYGMTPVTDHFACIVDLFSRAGLLEEAYAFLKAMPISAGEVLWMSLLGACRIAGSVELAQQVAEEVLKVSPQNSSAFVQLSNIYAVGETLQPG